MELKALAIAAGCALAVTGCQRQSPTATAPAASTPAVSAPAARPQFSFKGVPFGASLAEFKDKVPGTECRGQVCSLLDTPYRTTYAEVLTKLPRAEFGPGGFDGMSFLFAPGDYERLLEALKSKFGPPVKETAEEIKTIGGRPLQQATALWLMQGPAIMQIKRFYFDSEYGHFSVMTEANINRGNAEAASASQRVKKDM